MIAGLEILNLHAQGGMAEVFRARGQGADGTSYLYAIKRILAEYTRDPEIKRMFIEESRVAQCLVHPNVVRVYDLAASETEELYIVMEFLEGKDLSEGIEECEKQRKQLPIWFAIQMARDVLRALHYVTTEATDKNGRILGLIHRDISPHNIFVCFDGQVKLTDFGVAKVQESNIKTQVGITKGKLGYMSPEQLMGSPLDFRSDLYNVGILLFESITGRQLFTGASTAEFLQAMVRGVVPAIPQALQVPPELEALIRRSLDRDRTKRPATAMDFERELAQIADKYNLTASTAHIAHQMRELYGRPPPPPPGRPATAPQKLRSMIMAIEPPRPPTPSQPQAPVQPQPQYSPPPQPPPYSPPQPQHAPPQQPQYASQPQEYAPPQQQYSPPPQQPPYSPPPQQPPYSPPPQQAPYAPPPHTPQGGYQSPYAKPQAIAPPSTPLAGSDDDFATIVRPPAFDSEPAPPPQRQNERPASRPAAPLPADPVSQPRVQVAVSQRMQTLPSADPSRAQSEDMFETGTIEIERPPRTPTSPGNRRPATVARGNARPIEALPSVPRPNQPPPPSAPPPPSPQCAAAWQEATGESPEHNPDRTRIEPASTRPPAPASPASPDPPPTSPSAAPNPRPPTVQVGGGNVGVRSKRVVPLDDPKR